MHTDPAGRGRFPVFPLAQEWEQFRAAAARSAPPPRPATAPDLYLDLAEIIVRGAVSGGWQDAAGLIVDPYLKQADVHATARFTGAVGNLLAAGRCRDLAPVCERSYAALWHKIQTEDPTERMNYPEFWVKELMYAHDGLRAAGATDPALLERWAVYWRAQNGERYYGCMHASHVINNGFAFIAASEQIKGHAGFNLDPAIMDRCMDLLLDGMEAHGLYRDPQDPMMYGLVVAQLLDLTVLHGYRGQYLATIQELIHRAGLTFLLAQSTTGQMPFGGRSNHFHFNEAQFAAFCESRALCHAESGDLFTAGVYKRAARRAVELIEPWIRMEPLRQLKHGFDPATQHGIDSRGFYSVYSTLTASLLGTAHLIAQKTRHVPEQITPPEIGGYSFELWPAFHKVFATCAGYHVEIDTAAEIEKDTTGFGRLHRAGVWPETALSGGIPMAATYNYTVPGPERPVQNIAIGPEWINRFTGRRHRLADCYTVTRRAWLERIATTADRVEFRMHYEGNLGGLHHIVETYCLTADGVDYAVEAVEPKAELAVVVPLIKTDGLESSQVELGDGRISVVYRGCRYVISAGPGVEVAIRPDPPAANRNAIYQTGHIKAHRVRLSLSPVAPASAPRTLQPTSPHAHH